MTYSAWHSGMLCKLLPVRQVQVSPFGTLWAFPQCFPSHVEDLRLSRADCPHACLAESSFSVGSVDGPPGPSGSLPCDDSVGSCRLPCPPLLLVSAVLPPSGFKQPFPVIMRLHIFLYIYRPFGLAILWSAGIFILVFKNLFIDTGPLLVIYFATFFSHFVVQFYWHSGFSFFLSFEWREVLFTFIFWPHHMTCGILVLRPGLEPQPLALKSQSPNYWTAGKVLRHSQV